MASWFWSLFTLLRRPGCGPSRRWSRCLDPARRWWKLTNGWIRNTNRPMNHGSWSQAKKRQATQTLKPLPRLWWNLHRHRHRWLTLQVHRLRAQRHGTGSVAAGRAQRFGGSLVSLLCISLTAQRLIYQGWKTQEPSVNSVDDWKASFDLIFKEVCFSMYVTVCLLYW